MQFSCVYMYMYSPVCNSHYGWQTVSGIKEVLTLSVLVATCIQALTIIQHVHGVLLHDSCAHMTSFSGRQLRSDETSRLS